MALDVNTGALKWHFQHLPNDLWNYDWAFERTVVDLPVAGTMKRVVVTGGKQGIFDGLEVENGKYQFSIDMGLQNTVESVDPNTGIKSLVKSTIPEYGKTRFACPSSHGVRNWMPTAYNDKSKVLYIPFLESCMKINGDLSQKSYPRPDSDGNFGGLHALDLNTRETLWTVRRRGIPTTGVLATENGLIFAGFIDRMFSAYDANNGKLLWQARLNDIPTAAPISFMVGEKQYIAVTTGHGEFYAKNIDFFLSPEIKNPEEASQTLWVFSLPD